MHSKPLKHTFSKVLASHHFPQEMDEGVGAGSTPIFENVREEGADLKIQYHPPKTGEETLSPLRDTQPWSVIPHAIIGMYTRAFMRYGYASVFGVINDGCLDRLKTF